MVTSIYDPSTLLSNYYSHSYHFYGMRIPATVLRSALKLLLVQVGNCIDEFTLRSLRSQFAVSEEVKLRSHVGRIGQDVSWLKGTAAASALENSILDFGSGDESATRLTATVISARLMVAVDPRLKDANLQATETVRFYGDFPSPGELPRCDLVLMRHVLHHVPADRQEKIIKHVAELGSRDSFLCLVEDCVDRIGCDLPCEECGRAQYAWNAATKDERRSCLALNDIWSNCVAYLRGPSDQWHTFRTEEEWIESLSRAGYVVEDRMRFPFGHARLHGVPKLLLLARKK